MKHKPYILLFSLLLVALFFSGAAGPSNIARESKRPVKIKVFAPHQHDRAGIGGRGYFVDLAIQFDVSLEQSGFTAPQLTGPAAHNNTAPFPGTFSPGKDDRLPGLVVLLSTTTIGAGAGQNLANLFNLTGVTDVKENRVEIWDTWIVGAPNFGVDTKSTLYVAVVNDLNKDGIYNDAPDVVPDSNSDGMIDKADLEALGLASRVRIVDFYINP